MKYADAMKPTVPTVRWAARAAHMARLAAEAADAARAYRDDLPEDWQSDLEVAHLGLRSVADYMADKASES